ncbi:MAG: hypothetical protein JJ846_007785 [Prochlorococcus marinus CUG1437]|nr:hypothetical protein [Prochlorococcus marinus CUG1437]
MLVLLSLLISIFLSFFFLKKSLPLFNLYLIDLPNKRSSHKNLTPRGGGIVFVFAFILTAIIFKFYNPLYAIPIALIGLLDDYFSINRMSRFLIQFLTGVILLFNLPLLENLNNYSENYFINTFIAIFCLVFFSAIINFINFMDGIDGLIGGSFLVIFIFILFYLSYPLSIAIGSIIGFLLLNWCPARIFMGDVGSTFLGAILGILIFSAQSFEDGFFIFSLSIPLIIDSVITLLRRIYLKQNIFLPHRLHLYQRLALQRNWNHSKISLIYISEITLVGLLGIFASSIGSLFGIIICLIIYFIIDKNFTKEFLKSLNS